MSGSEQVMAVLLEEDDLHLVYRDWPRKMRLAVCLMPNGDCQLLLFRQEEAGIFAARMRKHLGLRPEELCIHPPIHGFPTRQLRYSDQQGLAALLADSPQLVEDATDYSVNFAFALEEGLDPVEFLGVEAAQDDDFTAFQAPAVDIAEGAALQFSSRRRPVIQTSGQAERRALAFDLAREAARSLQEVAPEPEVAKHDHGLAIFPGEAFRPLADFAAEETTDIGYSLREEGEQFVISNGSGPTVEIEGVGQLFLRDDRQLLALRIVKLEEGQPGTVRIPADLLPKSIKTALRAATGNVDVSRDGGFLYVTLPVQKDATAEVATSKPEAASRSLWKVRKRRAAVRLLALTSITAIAIYVVLGSEPISALNQSAGTGPIDWSQFRLSMQSDQ